MADEYPIPLWEFNEDGVQSGVFLVEDLSNLGKFTECSQWSMVENSLWRSDEDGELIGYYQVKDTSSLGSYTQFSASNTTDRCTRIDKNAFKCDWKGRRCCCIFLDKKRKLSGTCRG